MLMVNRESCWADTAATSAQAHHTVAHSSRIGQHSEQPPTGQRRRQAAGSRIAASPVLRILIATVKVKDPVDNECRILLHRQLDWDRL